MKLLFFILPAAIAFSSSHSSSTEAARELRTASGFDCELTRTVSDSVQIPVIASGGAGSAEDFRAVFFEGHADAALAASIFHYGLRDVGELKQSLKSAGIPMRWPC